MWFIAVMWWSILRWIRRHLSFKRLGEYLNPAGLFGLLFPIWLKRVRSICEFSPYRITIPRKAENMIGAYSNCWINWYGLRLADEWGLIFKL